LESEGNGDVAKPFLMPVEDVYNSWSWNLALQIGIELLCKIQFRIMVWEKLLLLLLELRCSVKILVKRRDMVKFF
jgi:hypothetical protein